MAQKMRAALQVADNVVWTKPGKDSKSKPNSAAATKTPGAPLGSNQALGQAMSSAVSYNKNIQLPTGTNFTFCRQECEWVKTHSRENVSVKLVQNAHSDLAWKSLP